MVSYASSHASLAFVLLTLVQAIIASGGLLLGSLYIARGVVDSVWSVGAWVAWVWYWCAVSVIPFLIMGKPKCYVMLAYTPIFVNPLPLQNAGGCPYRS